jgi:hypothetical protein
MGKYLFLFILFSQSLFATVVELPLGGVINLNLKEWSAQSTKQIPGASSMVFISKIMPSLQGNLFDGTIKEKGLCDVQPKTKAWTVCEKVIKLEKKLSHQIYAQRMLSPKIYQTYVFAFNYDPELASKAAPIIKSFSNSLEKKP